MPITQDSRGYATGWPMLELDSLGAGWPASASGGLAVSDVVEEQAGGDQVLRKHIAGVKYTDLELECGTGMSAGFYQWITDTLTFKYQRKNGAVVTVDGDYKERERLTFSSALISAVAFPALDGAAKDAAKLNVKLAPEFTKRVKGTGARLSSATDSKQQKKWLPANFKLEIDGLHCETVNRIEPIVVKVVVVENAVGELREYQKEPAHLELSDLVVTLAEANADSFYTWHENFVIKGLNDESYEKSGKLQLQTPNQETLFTLPFSGLGIYKLEPEKAESGAEGIRRVTASMYCQQLAFSVGTGAPAQPQEPEKLSTGEESQELLFGEYPGRFTRVRTTA